MSRPAINMLSAFCSIWGQILSQVTSYAWVLKVKDQFNVSCKKYPKIAFC